MLLLTAALGIGSTQTGRAGPPQHTRSPSTDNTSAYSGQRWRISGRLVSGEGNPFSYVATFFRYAGPKGFALDAASATLVDESTNRVYVERRTERADLGLSTGLRLPADASGTFDVRIGNWRLEESARSAGSPAFVLDATLDGVELHVRGVARKPRFASPSPSTDDDQYSSLSCTGSVTMAGRRLAVSGKSWIDLQRSRALAPSAAQSSEFRVQLDDGREIYIEADSAAGTRTERRSAYFVERNGTVENLSAASYEFGTHSGFTWLSPHTRTAYPDLWGLHVDGKTEFLSLEPVTYDQESIARGDGLTYWDGAVDVYDVTPGTLGLRLGSGYVLLRGYPKRPAIR